jgi:hypothetical protein
VRVGFAKRTPPFLVFSLVYGSMVRFSSNPFVYVRFLDT